MNKCGVISYVLVLDVSQEAGLFYYTGIFRPDNNFIIPKNTHVYNEALKLCFKDEAERLCAEINALEKCSFKYHVEEHMYQSSPPEGWKPLLTSRSGMCELCGKHITVCKCV